MYGHGDYGCGSGTTLPVCSKPAGNAKVSGGELCDMAGNVWEWVQDTYQDSYAGAPTDGSAFEASDSHRVVRGGSFAKGSPYDGPEARHLYLRADFRDGEAPSGADISLGFRLARSTR